jgi:hypothetical protein
LIHEWSDGSGRAKSKLDGYTVEWTDTPGDGGLNKKNAIAHLKAHDLEIKAERKREEKQ